MNCQVIQQRLLSAESPDEPGPEVRDHLSVCAACREWQHRLLQIETNVPRLPVPPSRGLSVLLQRLQTAPLPSSAGRVPGIEVLEPAVPVRTGRERPRLLTGLLDSTRGRLAVAGVAAAVLLALFLPFLFRGNGGGQPPVVQRKVQPAPDPLVAEVVQRDVGLAEANSPRQRIELLSGLADDLAGQTRTLLAVSRAEDLMDLATLYRDVVFEGVVKQAQNLPAGERSTVLPAVGKRLARTGREAEGLASERPASARPLHVIAEAAREGGEQLLPGGAVALGGGPETPTVPAEPARDRQLERNLPLVKVLVRGALQLAEAADPLKRAECCNGLAEQVAGEIRQAAEKNDGSRAAELGAHFQALLGRGVAANLSTARNQTPAGSTREQQMRRVGEEAGRVARPVEEQLQRARDADPEEMSHALGAVRGGWEEVQKVLQSPGPSGVQPTAHKPG